MEEKKNKKYIVIIVILIILLIGSVGYIVYDNFIKEDEIVNNNNQDNNDDIQDIEQNNDEDENNKLGEEEEIALVEDELSKIFACASDITSSDEYCCLIGDRFQGLLDSSSITEFDFFKELAPEIMQYKGLVEYIKLPNYTINTHYYCLMTDKQEQLFSDYFNIDLEFEDYDGLSGFNSYDEMYEYCEHDDECMYVKNYNEYANKGYKLAYVEAKALGYRPASISIVDVTSLGNSTYEVNVKVDVDNKISEILTETEVVDGNVKLGSMIVRK